LQSSLGHSRYAAGKSTLDSSCKVSIRIGAEHIKIIKREKQANEKISSRRLKLCGAAMDWELGGKTTEKRKNKQQQQEF